MRSSTSQSQITRVSKVSIIGNLLLSVFKLFVGIVAHSAAMVSDAVHSASDVFSSIIVIIGVKIAAKDPDEEHPYGHERMESVAAILLAVLLFVTGLFIGYTAIDNLAAGKKADSIPPGVLALVMAVVSIITKELMYWYTRFFARKLSSEALMADAWHHRSDALSSVGALVGIYGSRIGLWWADCAASLLISFFIVKVAYDIFSSAIDKMVDKSCDTGFEDELRQQILAQDGVAGIDLLHTRMFGNNIYVDLEISVDGEESLKEAHTTAQIVHDSLEKKYPQIKHIMIHINPA